MFHISGRLSCVVMAIVIIGSACATSEDEARINNALDQIEEINPDLNEPLKPAEQELEDCLRETDVDFGAALGDPDGLDERARLMQALIECEPDIDRLDLFVDSITGALELELDNEIDISRAEGGCLVRYILDNSDDPARTLSAMDSDDDIAVFLAGIDSCFSAENVAVLKREEGSQSYGDNARLDLMFDGCERGDMRLCDILAFESVIGSAYSEVATTCGGTAAATETSCSPEGAVDSATGFATSDSPGLVTLSTDCVAGDLTACDLLFLIAPIGTEFENTGYTCAGRIVIGANPDCRTRLAN